MANEITRNDAIKSLKPSAIYALLGDVVTWLDEVQTEPTTAEIDAEVIRLQAEYDSQAYARNRKAEYDQLNQFEMQFGLSSFDYSVAQVFNEAGADVDFRIESDDNDGMLFIDGGNDRVGIGTTVPSELLTIKEMTGQSAMVRFDDTDNALIGWIGVAREANDFSLTGPANQDLVIGSLGAKSTWFVDGAQINGRFTGAYEFVKEGASGTSFQNDGTGCGAGLYSDGDQGQVMVETTSTNARHMSRYCNPNGRVGFISIAGTTTTYSTSSDYRLKENVNYDWDATTRLKQLKPARFNFISDADTTLDGFLAHEVSDIVPAAVSGEKDALEKYRHNDTIPEGKSVGDIKDPPVIDPQGLDASLLVPLMVKTIQELEARIEALENP